MLPLKVIAVACLLTLCKVSAVPIQLGDFYPFGTAAGDKRVPTTDDDPSELITLNSVFPFYGTDHDFIVVRLYLIFGGLVPFAWVIGGSVHYALKLLMSLIGMQ